MADLTESSSLPRLSDYPRFVRRHWILIGVLAFLGLQVGLVWSLGQPTTYSATASVALTPVPKYLSPLSPEIAPPEVTIDTDAQLLRSPAVRTAVAQALGTDPDTAAGQLSVTATPISNVLHVTVTAGNPRAAAAAANAAVTELIDVRRNALGSLQLAQQRQLRLVVQAQQHLLADEQSREVVIPAVDDLFTELLTLKTSLQEVTDARRSPAGLVEPAVPPVHHDYPNHQVPIVSGAMLGFLCGVALGAARDHRLRARQRAAEHLPTSPFDARPDAVTPHEDHVYV
jgi:uncharacterized protein involved in exopolysaccharide biosynthesis